MKTKLRYFLYHIKIVVFVFFLAYLIYVLINVFDVRSRIAEEILMYSAWALSLLFTFQAVKVFVPLKFKQWFLHAFWKPYNPLRQIICKTENLYIKIVLTIIAIALCSIVLNGIEVSGDVDSYVSGDVNTDTVVSGSIDIYE